MTSKKSVSPVLENHGSGDRSGKGETRALGGLPGECRAVLPDYTRGTKLLVLINIGEPVVRV